MANTTQRIAKEVLAFLENQRLDPTPQNYSLGYHFISGVNAAITKAVGNATDGGIRLTQIEADEIIARHGVGSGGGSSGAESGTDMVRHQMLKLADITSSQSEATSRFGRDLTDGMSRMGEAAGDLSAIVSAMIERTAAAERELATTAAEAEQLRQDLDAARSDANQDALTQLPNRRSIDARLAKLEKAGKQRTLAFCDVDRFKRVNDTYGHAVGDRVLQAVGNVLSEQIGKKGTVARWGGEEFVVVFEGMAVQEAGELVDAARHALTEKRFKLRDTDQPLGMISFSAGVAGGSGTSAEIVKEADRLLYKAKQDGRNRIITQ